MPTQPEGKWAKDPGNHRPPRWLPRVAGELALLVALAGTICLTIRANGHYQESQWDRATANAALNMPGPLQSADVARQLQAARDEAIQGDDDIKEIPRFWIAFSTTALLIASSTASEPGSNGDVPDSDTYAAALQRRLQEGTSQTD